MQGADPQLFADERGIRQEDRPGSSFGIVWDEVHRVAGHKLDGVSEVFECVELEFEFGERLELYRHWPGFADVVIAISRRLPGIAPDWIERIEALAVADPLLEVWRRASTVRSRPCRVERKGVSAMRDVGQSARIRFALISGDRDAVPDHDH